MSRELILRRERFVSAWPRCCYQRCCYCLLPCCSRRSICPVRFVSRPCHQARVCACVQDISAIFTALRKEKRGGATFGGSILARSLQSSFSFFPSAPTCTNHGVLPNHYPQTHTRPLTLRLLHGRLFRRGYQRGITIHLWRGTAAATPLNAQHVHQRQFATRHILCGRLPLCGLS